MTEKKKLVLSSKMNSDAILKKMKEKQTSFGTNKDNTVVFDVSGQRRGGDRFRAFSQTVRNDENLQDTLTEEELKMRLAAIQDKIKVTESDENTVDDKKKDSLNEELNEIDNNTEKDVVLKDTSSYISNMDISNKEDNTNIKKDIKNSDIAETLNVKNTDEVTVEESIPAKESKNNVADDQKTTSQQNQKKPKSLDDSIRAEFVKTLGPKKTINSLHFKNKKDPSALTDFINNPKPNVQEEESSEKKVKVVSKVDKGTEKRQNKISLSNMLEEHAEKIRSMSAKRSSNKRRQPQNRYENRKQIITKEVSVPDFITVQELSNRAAVKGAEIVKILFSMGMPVTINQTIDADTAEIVLQELGHTCKREGDFTVESYINDLHLNAKSDIRSRPPIVTVMGHVDHGKTSLLDTIRKTDVISTESGGITQKIGAYQITLQNGKRITFIDTPGHEAFTEMRSRGATTTDIIVLVVAADDGVKTQTIEAIGHAKAANVPMIVAINKIDKPSANPDNVRNELLTHDIVLEKFGGTIPDVEISAKKCLNIDKLEEIILLTSDLMELKANFAGFASGVIIESQQKKGLGVVSTVLIKDGVLNKGDVFISGKIAGKVRSLMNDKGQIIKNAGPGTPVEVIGFEGIPQPGDDFVVIDDESKAREIAAYRDRVYRESMNVVKKTSLEQMFNKIDEEKIKKLSVIIKADVQGSVEAIVSSLAKMANEEVGVDVIYSGIGEITENDVILAKASQAVVFGFNVRANAKAREKAKLNDINILYHSIVYDFLEDVRQMLSGILSPEIKEVVIGNAEVLQVFNISKVGNIAGCIIRDGIAKRNSKARLLRENVIIYTTTVKSLRVQKNDTKEVKEGHECGIMLEGYQDIKVGDTIEFYEINEIARTI